MSQEMAPEITVFSPLKKLTYRSCANSPSRFDIKYTPWPSRENLAPTIPTLAGVGSTSRFCPVYRSTTYKYASEIDRYFNTKSLRSSGDQSSGYQLAPSPPVTASRGSEPASGSAEQKSKTHRAR